MTKSTGQRRRKLMSPEATFRYFMPGEPPPEGCWLWTGPRNDRGYGVIQCKANYRMTRIRAHRMSYLLFVGSITDDLQVRHTCDTPPCVQPAHLVAGTHADNMHDKVVRDRPRGCPRPLKGSASNLAKLTEADVLEMRALHASGWALRLLAERYGMTIQGVWMIVQRRNWKHI